ncbi:winged helix DNA-binding protein [Cupriavidus sp. IDO]|uniref:winged helix DNA-binding protein n=1 Tax=Cupriavidus sp. IDO TaxID=1539142 RepID=UPI00068B7B84|nr:winged helix DNA-binding protein [Cupriavidus sp. IDO]KWR91594.1 ABC transporter substrate-binding protein [Cupriavidus sp. IDO]
MRNLRADLTMPKSSSESAESQKTERTAQQHRWHLATDDFGVEITDLEYAVMRVYQSFQRWQSECLAAVTGITLSGQENALLHIIRMHERPKTIKDLLHMTNRQDVPNMQYELRKLLKAELIDKYGSARTGIYYFATDEGIKVCDEFARLRRETFLETARAEIGPKSGNTKATGQLEQLEKVYEIATREIATFHRRR